MVDFPWGDFEWRPDNRLARSAICCKRLSEMVQFNQKMPSARVLTLNVFIEQIRKFIK